MDVFCVDFCEISSKFVFIFMLEIFLLSLIQGLTEFLPVSSSGHLVLFPALFGWNEHSLEIDGMLHLGTLFAVLCYFFSDIMRMITAFLGYYLKMGTDRNPLYARLSLSIILATVPVVIAGLILKRIGLDTIRTPVVIAIASIIGGCFLYLGDRFSKQNNGLEDMTFSKALYIGLFQIISLIPGSSRSGMCLLGARLLGFDRVSATRYAFLLSIPAILGAFTLIFFDAYRDGIQTPALDLMMYFFLSFIFGLGAIHCMICFVQRHSFFVFMLYRILLGALILFMGL